MRYAALRHLLGAPSVPWSRDTAHESDQLGVFRRTSEAPSGMLLQGSSHYVLTVEDSGTHGPIR